MLMIGTTLGQISTNVTSEQTITTNNETMESEKCDQLEANNRQCEMDIFVMYKVVANKTQLDEIIYEEYGHRKVDTMMPENYCCLVNNLLECYEFFANSDNNCPETEYFRWYNQTMDIFLGHVMVGERKVPICREDLDCREFHDSLSPPFIVAIVLVVLIVIAVISFFTYWCLRARRQIGSSSTSSAASAFKSSSMSSKASPPRPKIKEKLIKVEKL